jgi:hypothetical protein
MKSSVEVYLHDLESKKSDGTFLEFFSKVSGWTSEQARAFLSENDTAVFRDRTPDEAVALVQDFQQLGVIGSIGKLHNARYYIALFKKFHAQGGRFLWSWNWAAALLSGLWQLFRGLWVKFVVYTFALMFLSLMLQVAPLRLQGTLAFIFWVAGVVFYGCVSNYDYFLKKTRDEALWSRFSYRRYWPIVWIVTAVLAVSFIFWQGWTIRKGVELSAKMNELSVATNQSIDSDGITFVPLAGWAVVSDIPTGLFQNVDTTVVMMRDVVEEPGKPRTQKLLGQLILSVHSPKSDQSFYSLEQEEVREIIEPLAKGYDQLIFKLLFKDLESQEPLHVDIGIQRWALIENVIQFKGSPQSTFQNLIYYTVTNGKLIVMYCQVTSENSQRAQALIEEFASTLEIRE